ncbi:MAG: hypothetical protein MJB57_14740 [Gemmatimonadetes bacterium]|nr:hypothetical protein [Gemmatimonadota bacterium]
MISSWLLLPLQAAGSAWTVQFGPWSLPPQAWLPATALIGAVALRTRARSFRALRSRAPRDEDLQA